jgi:general secretion pathway protein D
MLKILTAFSPIVFLLSSCAANQALDGVGVSDIRHDQLEVVPKSVTIVSEDQNGGPIALDSSNSESSADVLLRSIPNLRENAGDQSIERVQRPKFSSGRIEAILPPQSVPEFINTVFGELLEVGFTMGPNVANRQEIISLRTSTQVTKNTLYDIALNALSDYGIAVVFEDDQIRIVEQDDLRRQAPNFIRSRARAAVPGGMRPVIQFVEMQAISSAEMSNILNSTFPDRNRLSINVNQSTNSLTLLGLPEDVDAAMQIIDQMDELHFAGTDSAIVRVDNWDVLELVEHLQRLLSMEGYAVTSQQNQFRAITLYPIGYTQQVAVFARTREMLDHTIGTIRELDESAASALDRSLRVYKAVHYPASHLAAILMGTLGRDEDSELGASLPNADSEFGSSAGTSGGVSAGSVSTGSSGPTQMGDFVIDPQGNRIIYRATAQENEEMLQLLEVIDSPPGEVLIEVTIAEITLTDNTRYGLEFLFNQIGSRGYSVGFGTQGGIGLEDGGLSGVYESGDYVINFSALADNNQINVLSQPRIVTKSGATASIQVGTDVPIVTSQRSSDLQTGGTSDVLQQVEYRKTGILVDIEPLVLSGDRIDLVVSQEISAAESNPNQAIVSPLISNRSLVTELTLQDGQSAILGGLIEKRYTRGSTGVPIAKDLPLLGNLFKTETLSRTDTVLLMMITPYILRTREDRRTTVDAYVDYVNSSFGNITDESTTLIKPDRALEIERK